MTKPRHLAFGSLLAGGFVAAATLSEAVAAENTTVTIASGRAAGLYYPVAGAVCKLVNEHTQDHGIVCTIAFGVGSVTNIEALRDGKVTFAMTQSDIHRDAVDGAGPFEEAGRFEAMRSVASLFVEQVTIVARKDKHIASFEDLKGKRVYLAAPGSGGRILMQRLMEAEGWSPNDIDEISEYKASNLAEALCDGEFDALSVTVGHPSPLIDEIGAICNFVLVPVEGPSVEKIIAEEPLYAKSVVPADTYRKYPHEVPGLGVVATLVATDAADSDVVYEITKALFEGLDRLREASPIFRSLSAAQMANDGLTAPLHDGTARYYAEAGLR